MNLIGHKNTKKQIKVALESAKKRNTSLPHMMFSGAAGCGKTSMAREIAKINDVDFISMSPEVIKDTKSVLKLMEHLNHDNYDERGDRVGVVKPSVLFFDEIHKMPLAGQEPLGIAMEDYKLETGRANKFYWLPYFTVIGATTLAGNLSKPFRDRFKMDFVFQPYSFEESCGITVMHADRLDMMMTPGAIEDVARRGRGVPRVIIRYLERIRDMALANNAMIIMEGLVALTFDDLGIDTQGFSDTEIKILKYLYKSEAPVGLENLSIMTNESPKTIKDKVEPYLIQRGFIARSGSGRVITRIGREYLDEQGYTAVVAGKTEISGNYVRK